MLNTTLWPVFRCAAAAACALCLGCGGWSSPRPASASAQFEVRTTSRKLTADGRKAVDLDSGDAILLTSPPVISTADVATVEGVEEGGGRRALKVNLTPAGAQKLAAATAAATGQRLAVIVNGQVISAPTVRSPLSRSFQISGSFIHKERERILDALTQE